MSAKRITQVVTYACLLVVAVLVIAIVPRYPASARHFPYTVSAALLVLAAIGLLGELRGAAQSAEASSPDGGGSTAIAAAEDVPASESAAMAARLLGYAVLVLVAGFAAGAAVFNAYYLKAIGYGRNVHAVITGLLTFGILYGLSVILVEVGVPIYDGVAFGAPWPGW